MVWKAQQPELTVEHLLRGRSRVVLHRIVQKETPGEQDFVSAFVLGNPPPRRLQKESESSSELWCNARIVGLKTLGPQAALRVGTSLISCGV